MVSQDSVEHEPGILTPLMPEMPQPTAPAPAPRSAFQDHGTEIEEIISSRLPFVVQWGTVIFFFILLLLGVVCWFIQYPDIVTASGKLNSVNAPRKVITRTDGRLMKIAVRENDAVQAGQVLGYMESTASPQAVSTINGQLETINRLLTQNRTEEVLRFLPSYSQQHALVLGELQPAYQTFTEAFIQFKEVLRQGFLQRKRTMLLTDLQNIQRMHHILTEQRGLLQQDLALTNKTFEANKVLVESNVIASLDYRNEKSKLLAKQLTLPQINATMVANEGLLNAKKEDLAELDNQISTQRYAFVQAVRTIKSQVQAWEAKYLLKASVAGRVAFTGFFQENQEMKAGQSLFYVQPTNSLYFIEIIIPQYNFGKVRLGQAVALKFQAYPFEQYGAIVGRVDYIDGLPTNKGYLAKVSLPNGLLTNQKKQLHYQEGLVVQADIITENMRLLERFYYDLARQLRM